jgi:hypothetical protein
VRSGLKNDTKSGSEDRGLEGDGRGFVWLMC